jgi:hypothetical protein
MKTAFPTIKRSQYYNVSTTADEGMTLRDYFAAKAMNGIFNSAIDWFSTGQKADEESLKVFKDIAQDSYAMADAMMKAREQ